jgi:predicted dehydrogenase
VAEACAAARRQGLTVVSGLCFRRDEDSVGMIRRIHDGGIGRPLVVRSHAVSGLPWQKPFERGWSLEEWRQRNWISFRGFSGGHFVEHHIQAIDRGLWALGDACPVTAVAVEPDLPATAEPRPAGWSIGDCDERVSVRYSFADGSFMEASCERAAVREALVSEVVIGTAGSCDLRNPASCTAADGTGGRGVGSHRSSRYQSTMDALLSGVRSGAAVDDGSILCRSTLAAIMGRLAAATRQPVRWTDIAPPNLPVDPAPTIVNGMIDA